MSTFQQRVRRWAALALLRCVSSSPAAAAAALRARAARPSALDPREADRLGQQAVFDLVPNDERESELDDATPAADTTEEDATPASSERQRLQRLARDAEALLGDADPKLNLGEGIVRELVRDGFSPIVFCRYVATAHYVAVVFKERRYDNGGHKTWFFTNIHHMVVVHGRLQLIREGYGLVFDVPYEEVERVYTKDRETSGPLPET